MAKGNDLAQKKAAMRRIAKDRLTDVSSAMTREWGMKMLENLRALPVWSQSRTIMCFMSMGAEPNTEPMLRQILKECHVLCLPRQTQVPGIMEAHRVAGLFGLCAGPHGILEPPEATEIIPPEKIDLIITPCLAASPDGIRLGHGGGYYDRFFARCPSATKALLCPSQQIFDTLPHDEQDLPAHLIITEKGVL